MKCFVNGRDYSLSTGIIVSEFLKMQSINTSGIALAINEEVLPKSQWDKTEIKDNDQILLITATQGG